MKDLDIVGIALILFAMLWASFFPSPRYSDIGSYSIAQLLPIIIGASGLIFIVVARLKGSPKQSGAQG